MNESCDREILFTEMKQNHRLYEEAFEKRVRGELSQEDFCKLERKYNNRGSVLRDKLGIGAKSLAGAFCRKCGKYFKVADTHRKSFIRCSDHRHYDQCEAVKSIMNED